MKVKRTYNLSEGTIRAVKELAEEYHVASSQDGVVETAVEELRRRIRDTEEARLWEQSRSDADFVRESHEIEIAYATADAETWPK